MGLSYSEFKTCYNNEYYDRFDYPSPEIDPFVGEEENTKNYKHPDLRDFGTGLQVYRRKHVFPGDFENQRGVILGSKDHMSAIDQKYFRIFHNNMHYVFVNYTSRKAFECIHTYGSDAPRFCENEIKRHLLLADKEVKWKFDSMVKQHGIEPIAHIPPEMKYESEEFKEWLGQNAMSFMFPLYLSDYIMELNEY